MGPELTGRRNVDLVLRLRLLVMMVCIDGVLGLTGSLDQMKKHVGDRPDHWSYSFESNTVAKRREEAKKHVYFSYTQLFEQSSFA